MESNKIRQTFLDFFRQRGHKIVPSAPMVVKDDPTLMFTNAGMNQFKDIFLGNNPAPAARVADSQKCLRVSGKHNDLEEVGRDTYHHTMFEMLGNWSFGDYFKKEAIDWAWELLVGVFGLPEDRIYATVFEGDATDGVGRDEEAYQCWKKYLPEDHILNGNKKDNFWEMGETGPCGPCSEIHFDLRPQSEREQKPGRELVNEGHPLVIEIWNLVFMQYNRRANGSLEELPARHVDTGMGFERLCMVLQGKTSSYDTDVFQPFITEIGRMSGTTYGVNEKDDIAMRVIADHLRAVCFSIADGQLPSNVKAGYVIRRILRRAIRFGYTYLGFETPFIYKLVPLLADRMGSQYPELVRQKDLIEKIIREEESSFMHTLASGISLLENIMANVKKEGSDTVSGSDAFTLYDTFGFPIDLTSLICEENGLKVDIPEFEKQLAIQKERSRNAAATESGDWTVVHPGTETVFTGYDSLVEDIKILRYRQVQSKNRSYWQLVFDRTPFYAAGGGQVGDTGNIETAEGEKITVRDTIRENNLLIHITDTLPSDPAGKFIAVVDVDKRNSTERNHTATHLLHEALREVLGTHVEQKGSFVSPDALRFDFSHFQKLTDEEIKAVEKRVNKRIRLNYPLDENREATMDTAREMGAMMLFGEKYGDKVRVVRFGDSVELCGGTHSERTGNLGLFKILSESAISAGIRRIEAITGRYAEKYVLRLEDTLKEIQSFVNNPSVLQAVKKMFDENEDMRQRMEKYKAEKTVSLVKNIKAELEEQNGIVLFARVMELPPDIMKDIAFGLRAQVPNLVMILGSVHDEKPMLTIMLGDSIVVQGLNASEIVRIAAKEISGGGGGQQFYATAGGKNTEGIDRAVAVAVSEVMARLGKPDSHRMV